MKKMANCDVSRVVKLIRNWKGRTLTWEAIRAEIGQSQAVPEHVWSRQALQANEDIRTAWLVKKESIKNERARIPPSRSEAENLLQSALAANRELQMKYDNLAFRHRQLIYNAVLLPGGAHLLVDPLPDNTADQSAHR